MWSPSSNVNSTTAMNETISGELFFFFFFPIKFSGSYLCKFSKFCNQLQLDCLHRWLWMNAVWEESLNGL